MVREAVLHKMDQEFCYALSEGKFLVRIRTKKGDCKSVVFWYTEKYGNICGDESRNSIPMTKVSSDDLFDYYEVIYQNEALVTKYYFELEDQEGNIVYYGNYRFQDSRIEPLYHMFDIQKHAREVEEFPVIDWMSEGVVYQIFPDRFYRGSHKSQEGLLDWNKKPEWHETYGGTLRGITEKLDYLKELGITILYLTPIFEANSNHKYNTKDYMKIDKDFGTKEDLSELVKKAHENGMKVILDGVFNHTGDEFMPFLDMKEKEANSNYKNWFQVEEFPLIARAHEKPNYGTFSYHGGMPQLNPDATPVKEYIKSVIEYWMRECNIDGWRLDVADEISHPFWKEFRSWVKSEKSDAPIIGEVWYDSSAWLQGDEFDTVMNYPFFNNVIGWIGSGNLKPSDFVNQLGFLRGKYHVHAHQMLWNLIDSHDSERFLNNVGEDKRKLRLAALLQFTLTGTPMIYYGDEVGMSGGMDPDCRRGMIWEKDRQDQSLFEYYKRVIRLRKHSKALMNGEFNPVVLNDEKEFLIFEKIYERERIYVAINNGGAPVYDSMLEGVKDEITGNYQNGSLEPFTGVIFYK